MTFEEGVVRAVADMGVDVLEAPLRLVGYLKDVCGDDCLEVTVLERNCDDEVIEPFREAAAMGTIQAIDVGRRRSLAILVERRGIDAEVAKSICDGLCAAVGNSLGFSPQQLSDSSANPSPASISDSVSGLGPGGTHVIPNSPEVSSEFVDTPNVEFTTPSDSNAARRPNPTPRPGHTRNPRSTTKWILIGVLALASVAIAIIATQLRGITFDGNGAEGGSVPATWYIGAETVELPENGFTRSGYVFEGWDSSPDAKSASYVPGSQYTVVGQDKLYAIWGRDRSADVGSEVVGDDVGAADSEEERGGLNERNREPKATKVTAVSAGDYFTVGLRSDGTVISTSTTHDLSDWKNVVAVSAGSDYAVAVRSDGTVLATGDNTYGQCDVSDWTDVVAVSAGFFHTVAVRSDGTVLATGYNGFGQCDVSGWTDVVAVAADSNHTVALRSDGTVLATGINKMGECDVSDWSDVISISAGDYYTVAVRSDGTVLATGSNIFGACNVSSWTDVASVSASDFYTVAVRSDGTVLMTGNDEKGEFDISDWTDVVSVSAGRAHIVALRSDGTVLATGENGYGQCDVSSW